MKNNIRMTRLGWNAPAFVVAMPGLQLPPFNTPGDVSKNNARTAQHIGEDTPLDSQPYFARFDCNRKTWQPGWIPSQADLFAEDWYTF